MTVYQLKRSSTANKRPDPALLLSGELALNYDVATGGVYYTNDAGTLSKIGPAQVSATAPNSSPAGSAGNALGEFWYDTTNSELKIWDGTQWILVSAGQLPTGFYENGGAKILGTVGPNTATSGAVINFDQAEVNFNLESLSYSNGVFTNTSPYTRNYSFNFQLNISSINNATFAKNPWYIWFQKNNSTTFDGNNPYGLSSYVYTTNQATQVTTQSTAWSFTLAPGDTVSCWSSFPAEVLTYAATSTGTNSPHGTRVNVSEYVLTGTGYQSGGWAEYASFTGSTVAGDQKIPWQNLVAKSTDFSLTWDQTNRQFINNTSQTRTFQFEAVVAGANDGQPVFTTWAAWFTKNVTGATPGSNRFGQQVQLTPGQDPGSLVAKYPVSRTISWTLTLAPGETVQTWYYVDSSQFISNWFWSTPAGQVNNTRANRLKITELQVAQSPDYAGAYINTLSAPVAITANTDTLIQWNGAGTNDIASLEYANGIFTNTSTETRTYLISNQVAYTTTTGTNAYLATWLQINDAAAASYTSRYCYWRGNTNTNQTLARSWSQVITLQPGETFTTWVNASANGSISASAYGMASTNSTRLSINDITVVTPGFGTITGVIAGTGLSGGGFTGAVTVDLDPATTTFLGGVKGGSNVAIATDGTISVNPGGATTQIQFNNAGVFSGDADLTYNSTTNTLSVPVLDGATLDCGAF